MKALITCVSQKGFSLLELMIAAALGLTLSTAILSVLFSVSSVYKLKIAVEELQENSSLVLHFIKNDLSVAGFKGCFNKQLKDANLVSKGVIGEQLRYFDFIHGEAKQYKTSDALTFVSIIDEGLEVATTMSTVHSSIDFTKQERDYKGYELLITDCENADLFSVTNVWNQRISHQLLNNTDANLSIAYRKGAIAYPLSLVKYKLAKGAGGNTGLYRHVNNGQAQELIPNVEAMKISFMTIDPLTNKRNIYLAGDTFNHEHLINIEIQLLLSSSNEVLAERARYTNFNNQGVVATDRRLYRSYSLNITLRNTQITL